MRFRLAFAIREWGKVVLKPQDLVVALRLVDAPPEERTYPKLAAAVGMSPSEVHASVDRASKCGLVNRPDRSVRSAALLEFLVHAVKYVFPPEWTGMARGVPTLHAAYPLTATFYGDSSMPVWPLAAGTTYGIGLTPLYRSVPKAALKDARLYAWLVLVDAIRAGRPHERGIAWSEFQRMLSPDGDFAARHPTVEHAAPEDSAREDPARKDPQAHSRFANADEF